MVLAKYKDNVETIKNKYANKARYVLETGEATILAKAFKDGDSDAGNMLFAGLRNFVMQYIFKYSGLTKYGYENEDLMEICNEGIMKAICKFDFDRGVEFSTFLTYSLNYHFKNVCNHIATKNFDKNKKRIYCDSLENYNDAEEGVTNISSFLTDDKEKEQTLIDKIAADKLVEMLDTLPYKYKFVLKKYFIEEQSYQKIATELGFSKEYIRRTVNEGVEEIKRQMHSPDKKPKKIAFIKQKNKDENFVQMGEV